MLDKHRSLTTLIMAHCKAAHSIHALTAIGPDSLHRELLARLVRLPAQIVANAEHEGVLAAGKVLGDLRPKVPGA